MSRRNRKYKRIETLFSKDQPVAPDSPLRSAAKTPAPGIPAEDLTGGVEETPAQPSASDTRPESAVPPTAASPAGGRQDFVNGIDRGQKTESAYDQEKATSLAKAPQPPPENALCVPLMVSGITLGTMQAARNEAGWTAQEIEIVGAVTAQLAQHIENLRRLDQNKKPAHE